MSQTIHRELLDLRKQAKAWLNKEDAVEFRPWLGICHNVDLEGVEYADFWYLMEKWPGGSGVPAYPVPAPKGNARDAYRVSSPHVKWNPRYKYARNRWALLDWLIDQTAPTVQLKEKS